MTRRLNFKFKKLENHPITVVELDGQIDSAKSIDSIEEIAAAPDAGHVVFQMEGVTYINSSGCGGLIALHHKMASRGFQLFLMNPTGGVERVITHLGCHKIIRVSQSLQEIIKEVG
jgi:stage II sporulation protein AA (anti-sigma F factor antagonist)